MGRVLKYEISAPKTIYTCQTRVHPVQLGYTYVSQDTDTNPGSIVESPDSSLDEVFLTPEFDPDPQSQGCGRKEEEEEPQELEPQELERQELENAAEIKECNTETQITTKTNLAEDKQTAKINELNTTSELQLDVRPIAKANKPEQEEPQPDQLQPEAEEPDSTQHEEKISSKVEKKVSLSSPKPLSPSKPSRSRQPPLKLREENNVEALTKTKAKANNKENNQTSTDHDIPTPKLHCICRTEWEDGELYIGCDYCAEWMHGKCVGITDASGIVLFRCPTCIKLDKTTPMENGKTTKTSANKTQNEQHKHKETDEIKSQLADLKSKLDKSESTCKKWKENSSQLQSEINKKQKAIDIQSTTNFKLKSDTSQLKKSIDSKERELKLAKDECDELKKKLKAASNTADMLSKKCTKQEKNVTTKNLEAKKMNGRVAELEKEAQQQDNTIKNLQKDKSRLEKEKETQKRLLETAMKGKTTDSPETSTETSNDGSKEKLRKANQEINSLKDLTKNLEIITRDLQAEKQTLYNELDAEKHNLQREKHINNILMNFTSISNSPSNTSSKPDTLPANRSSHPQPPPPPPVQPPLPCLLPPAPEGQHPLSYSGVTRLLNQSQQRSSNLPPRNDRANQPLMNNNLNTSHNGRSVGARQNNTDFCRAEFQERGSCLKGHNCTESHEINFNKLKRGLCFNEFFEKNSCRNG